MSFRLYLEELNISQKFVKTDDMICNGMHAIYEDYFSPESKLMVSTHNETKLSRRSGSIPSDAYFTSSISLNFSSAPTSSILPSNTISDLRKELEELDKDLKPKKNDISEIKQSKKTTFSVFNFSWGSQLFFKFFTKKEKYEIRPSRKQASYVLYSMQNINKIKQFLHSFPKLGENKFGCCATLAWSGIKNYNVPVQCYKNQSIGFILDEKHIIVPQADILAKNSGGMLQEEILKADAVNPTSTSEKLTTKFSQKAGYYRTLFDKKIFVTNLACYERLPGKTGHTYHQEGSAPTLSLNVWRKFFKPQKPNKDPLIKNGIMLLNEAIVFSNEKKPIKGLMITSTPPKGDTLALALLLKENPSLKLYLYNVNAEEHIMRYIENDEAQECLEQLKMDFDNIFKKAIPYENVGENQKPVFKRG